MNEVKWLAVFLMACAQAAAPARAPTAVKAKTLALEPIRDTSDFIGSLNSRQSVTLQAQVSGYVSRVYVKPGDKVAAGALLIQIDGSREEAALRNVQAQRGSRLASLEYAKAQAERNNELVGTGVVSQQSVDQAKSAANAAAADLTAVDAQIHAQQALLQYYRITAPAAGVVGDIPVKVGDLVSPGTKLTSVTQGDALELYVQIPVEKAPKITPETKLEIVDESGNAMVASKLSFISPQVEPDTQLLLIKAVFANKTDLRFAQFVRARVVWSVKDGLLLPASAVQRVSGQTFAYVIEGDTAKQRPVTLGDITDNAYVVRNGLEVGSKVVTAGVEKLVDGTQVKADLTLDVR